jgi:cyclopropane-fatty-acyl-phospholipid synthase
MLSVLIDLMERGLLPEAGVRLGIRKLCQNRLKSLEKDSIRLSEEDFELSYIESLRASPIAFATEKANQQHYEVPAEFYNLVLGRYKKYSCGLWPEGCNSLDESELQALKITAARAEIQDGMSILDLGCGWGSMSLYLAGTFPKCQITAVSNSSSQKMYIEQQASARGLENIQVVTADVSIFKAPADWQQKFDRIVSIEMLEHMRNYEALFARISGWLKRDGKFFAHVFSHNQFCYPFETEGTDNWMGKYFFTGGQMPSRHLFAHFQKDLILEKQWIWNGRHYQKTSDAWLRKMESNKPEVLKILAQVYGPEEAARWYERWRVFFMSCSELFGYREGLEWGVSHHLFSPRK